MRSFYKIFLIVMLLLPILRAEKAPPEERDLKKKLRQLRGELMIAVRMEEDNRAAMLKKVIDELENGNDVDVEGLVNSVDKAADPDIDEGELRKIDKELSKKSGDKVRTVLNKEQKDEYVARGLLIDGKKKIIEGNYTFAEKMLGDALNIKKDDPDIKYYYQLLQFPSANVVAGKSVYSQLKKEKVVFGMPYADNPEGIPEWVKSWELRVMDENGRTVKSFEGEGPVAPNLTWDPVDEKGKPVREGKYKAILRLNGNYFTKFDTEPLSFELMAKPPAIQIKLEQKMFLAGEEDVDIGIIVEDESVMKSWEIIIVNQEGTELKRLQGEKFNITEKWDGKKENGELVSEGDTLIFKSFYVDTLDKKWEGNSEKIFSDIKIINNKIVLNNIQFESGKARLMKPSLKILDKVVNLLKDKVWLDIVIEGHTDSVGDTDYNLELSKARAKEVGVYFIRKGIEKSRLKARGFGESTPIASNDTEAGKARNRRVEFQLNENKEKLEAYYTKKRQEAMKRGN